MSSYRKNRSYRKIDNINAFPDDFFSTLNLSNIKNGPKMSRSICRQIKKNDKISSRICKRERSLDISESYLLATPDVNKHQGIRFPRIDSNRGVNTSMFDEDHNNLGDFSYDLEKIQKYDTGQRRLHKYMKSEDRFRKSKNMAFNKGTLFNINIRETQGLMNSPICKLVHP